MRTLIAGFGNVLRGDDGFGVAVLRRLEAEAWPAHVALMEVGTGGIRLAQELLDGYERLVLVDAMSRGGAPGSLYVLEVTEVGPVPDVDMHLAVPERALALAKALGALPARVFMVGCEPQQVDELTLELTAPVAAAVERAAAEVCRLVAREAAGVGARA